MRGWASKARPMATRCFSPPESVLRPSLQQRPEAEQLDDARLVDDAILRRAQPLAVEQVRFHVHVREQQRVLEDVADASLFGRQIDASRGVEQEHVVDADVTAQRLGDPGDGVDHAGLAGTGATEETDDRRVGGESGREVEGAELLLDVNVDHRLESWRSDG